MTPTTVRTAAPRRGRAPLPLFPHEVPLPATFGDWYHLAAGSLGLAERRDSGVLRLLAGLLLVALCSFGLGAGVGPALAVLVDGGRWQGSDVAALALGVVVVLATLAWWAWYRRDWVRARRLRWAWATALRDPRVLALPADRHAPGHPDPETQHPYRRREAPEGLNPYPGVRSVGGVAGALDALRGVLHPLALTAGVVLLAGALGQPSPGARLAVGAAALPLVLAALGGTARAGYRLARSTAVAALQRDDVARWTGWRVLHGLAQPQAQRPPWRRADLALLPLALVGLLLYLGRLTSGTITTVHVVVGVGLVAVPVAVLLGSFGVRVLRARSGGPGVGVRLLPDDVPPLGPTAVPPGPARLVLGGEGPGGTGPGGEGPRGAVRVARADGGEQRLAAVALVSGVPHLVATRRHWLVLDDGSQVPLECAAVRDLRGAAVAAGLRVL
ncbi:hypothetical protein [Puerhibacterium puerhi]|uniref:hypothetical protein n=1 Tax=Puerhibacterium puerhi TaxID=2692623 RepID=UPI0013594DD8|nr:hypothetical protein [Puerhibacterium puerhi]